jgi:hypothetical protein
MMIVDYVVDLIILLIQMEAHAPRVLEAIVL